MCFSAPYIYLFCYYMKKQIRTFSSDLFLSVKWARCRSVFRALTAIQAVIHYRLVRFPEFEKKKALLDKLADAMVSVVGGEIKYCSMSTDCNIPLSMGIPASCIGVFYGKGAHTREEWIEKKSIKTGLEVGITTLIKLF